jgi:hypothetical protein
MNWMAELMCRLRGHNWERSYEWPRRVTWRLCRRCERWLSFAEGQAAS